MRSISLACMAALLVAGCSGGGGGQPPAPAADNNQPPASASTSSEGLVSYIGQLTASASDSAAPVDLAAFTPPAASDTALPVPTANDGPAH